MNARQENKFLESALVRLARDKSGGTAIEYALIAGGIFVAIIAAVTDVGVTLITFFGSLPGMF